METTSGQADVSLLLLQTGSSDESFFQLHEQHEDLWVSVGVAKMAAQNPIDRCRQMRWCGIEVMRNLAMGKLRSSCLPPARQGCERHAEKSATTA